MSLTLPRNARPTARALSRQSLQSEEGQCLWDLLGLVHMNRPPVLLTLQKSQCTSCAVVFEGLPE